MAFDLVVGLALLLAGLFGAVFMFVVVTDRGHGLRFFVLPSFRYEACFFLLFVALLLGGSRMIQLWYRGF